LVGGKEGKEGSRRCHTGTPHGTYKTVFIDFKFPGKLMNVIVNTFAELDVAGRRRRITVVSIARWA
jgi:hypothetical protein